MIRTAWMRTCNLGPFYFRHKDAVEMVDLVLDDPWPESIKLLSMHWSILFVVLYIYYLRPTDRVLVLIDTETVLVHFDHLLGCAYNPRIDVSIKIPHYILQLFEALYPSEVKVLRHDAKLLPYSNLRRWQSEGVDLMFFKTVAKGEL